MSFYHGVVTRFWYRTIRPLRSFGHDQPRVSLDGFGGGNHRREQRAALVYNLASSETDRNAHADAAYGYGHVDVVLHAALQRAEHPSQQVEHILLRGHFIAGTVVVQETGAEMARTYWHCHQPLGL